MKAVYALMGASVLMILFGIFLISMEQQTENDDIPDPEVPAPERDIGVIPSLPEDAEAPDMDEADLEPGSDAWCEHMMRLEDELWSPKDSRTFADNCIYD